MHTTSDSHLVAAKRILNYLSGAIGLGLLFHRGYFDFLCLHAYSDSAWAGDSLDRHSTSGYLIFLGSNPFFGLLRNRLFLEILLRQTAAELCWLRQILTDFHVYRNKIPCFM